MLNLPKTGHPVTDHNFLSIGSVLLDTGGQAIGVRFGVGGWVFPGGGPASNSLNVAHGLGKAPIAVFVQTTNAFIVGQVSSAPSSTTFTTQGRHKTEATVVASTINFYWLAIG